MRNALVLVPLCIGLTSGFIVPTTTLEAKNTTQTVTTVKKDPITHDKRTKNASESIASNSYLCHIKGDSVKQQIYDEGSKKDKNIEERSFIVVKHHWSKLDTKNNSVNDKLPNLQYNDHQKSYLNVFQESSQANLAKAVVAHEYLKDKQKEKIEYNKSKNKSFFATTIRIDSKIQSNHKINSRNQAVYKELNAENNFIEILKTSLLRPSKQRETPAIVENKITNTPYKKHFMEISKENYNIEVYTNKKEYTTAHQGKPFNEQKERIEDTSRYINKTQNQGYDPNVETIMEQKLFHLLLEEQVPVKQNVNKQNTSSVSDLKYCRKCVQLTNIFNGNRTDKECICKCGRYIHLKGRKEPNN